MENQIVKIDPKEFGLEEKNVVEIENAFVAKIAERDAINEIYKVLITKELTPELVVEARELRLKLVKVRTGIADVHKTQKAYFLASGKYVDAWKKKETITVRQMEETLNEIETHFVKLEEQKRLEEEQKRLKLQKEREEAIIEYIDDASLRNLADMDEDVWKAFFASKKTDHENKLEGERIAREKAEKQRAFEELKNKRRDDLFVLHEFIDNIEAVVGIENEEEYNNVVSVFKEEKRLKEEEEAKIKAFENMKGIRRKALFPYLNFIDDIDMMVSIEDEMVYLEEFNAVKNAKKRADEEAAKIKRFEELKKKRREDLITYISFIDNFEAVVCIENEKEFENKLKEIKEAKRLYDEEVSREKQKKEEEEKALQKLLNSRASTLIGCGFVKNGNSFFKDVYIMHIAEIANISHEDFKNKIFQINENITRDEKLKKQEIAQAKAKAEKEQRLRIEEENRQKELNKGDEDKVNDLINDLESLKTKYKFESTKSIKVYNYNGRLIYEVAL